MRKLFKGYFIEVNDRLDRLFDTIKEAEEYKRIMHIADPIQKTSFYFNEETK